VIAGDNLFEDYLGEFVRKGILEQEALVAIYDLEEKSLAQEYGVVSLAKNGKIRALVEKSPNPPSALVATCIYFFPKRIWSMLEQYIALGENLDAPGHFLKWLVGNDSVQSYLLEGAWYDIGSRESYESVQKKK
jgi:glucose-1-phosphate thymidylyltransferase